MHGTRTPLLVWFWCAYLATTHTPGLSAIQFQRQLGIKRYESAFQILHKLRAAMVRPGRDKIETDGVHAEVDETYVGLRTSGPTKEALYSGRWDHPGAPRQRNSASSG